MKKNDGMSSWSNGGKVAMMGGGYCRGYWRERRRGEEAEGEVWGGIQRERGGSRER